ncbi:MAG: histidinol-phosphate transaminase [Clostridiales bacterium]|nr:histidinol-phosphate transaminase [Clostridiales bacterium]
MSKFFSKKYAKLTPYVPGEQPKDIQYIKLNTNESPFPLPKEVIESARAEAEKCQLYSDPTCTELIKKASEVYKVKPSQILPTNGSDEILNFAFMAFCDKDTPAVFADITYGFYSVFAELNGVPYKTIALKEDFSIDYKEYLGVNATVFIANPNAPTGLALSKAEIEEIVKSNPDNVVVIDEAYVDFGGESVVSLIDKYENLLVTHTFSKSRSMAGARLGLGFACEKLIADLNTVKYSTNPYNVNRMTMEMGRTALCRQDYFDEKCKEICAVREFVATRLRALGFSVLPSKTNFLFITSPAISGEKLYKKLKARGILVRHFEKERIRNYNRVTIGTREQMQTFLETVQAILEEEK